MTHRWKAAFILVAAVLAGAALAFCYRGDWLAAGLAVGFAAVPVVALAVMRFRAEMVKTRATLRALAQMTAVADRMLAESQRRARRALL